MRCFIALALAAALIAGCRHGDPSSDVKMGVSLPSGSNAIMYSAGFSIPTSPDWEQFDMGHLSQILRQVDPTLQGETIAHPLGDLSLWRANAKLMDQLFPTAVVVLHQHQKSGTSLEKYVEHFTAKAGPVFVRKADITTPIGKCAQFVADAQQANLRGDKIPIRNYVFLFSDEHDEYELDFNEPVSHDDVNHPIFEQMVQGFRVFNPDDSKQDELPVGAATSLPVPSGGTYVPSQAPPDPSFPQPNNNPNPPPSNDQPPAIAPPPTTPPSPEPDNTPQPTPESSG